MSLISISEIINVIIAIIIADMFVEYLKILYKRHKRKQKRLLLERMRHEKDKKNIIPSPVKEQTVKRV